MIVRELPAGDVLVISQESHADVAAQFAAHWGNERFARLEPYQSMVFGTVYHDSGHREMEANLPINPEKGLPYNFRGAPPEIRDRQADVVNSLWIRQRDPYASLVVSMHHAGLRKRRYDTVRVGGSAHTPDGPALGMSTAIDDLQGWQIEVAHEIGLDGASVKQALWHNYCMLQVFDLLSLHFCCDGYEGERLKESVLENVPVKLGSDELTELRLTPTGGSGVQFAPYPFDVDRFEVSVLGRLMAAHVDVPAEAVKDAYHVAPREMVRWEITR